MKSVLEFLFDLGSRMCFLSFFFKEAGSSVEEHLVNIQDVAVFDSCPAYHSHMFF